MKITYFICSVKMSVHNKTNRSCSVLFGKQPIADRYNAYPHCWLYRLLPNAFNSSCFKILFSHCRRRERLSRWPKDLGHCRFSSPLSSKSRLTNKY